MHSEIEISNIFTLISKNIYKILIFTFLFTVGNFFIFYENKTKIITRLDIVGANTETFVVYNSFNNIINTFYRYANFNLEGVNEDFYPNFEVPFVSYELGNKNLTLDIYAQLEGEINSKNEQLYFNFNEISQYTSITYENILEGVSLDINYEIEILKKNFKKNIHKINNDLIERYDNLLKIKLTNLNDYLDSIINLQNNEVIYSNLIKIQKSSKNIPVDQYLLKKLNIPIVSANFSNMSFGITSSNLYLFILVNISIGLILILFLLILFQLMKMSKEPRNEKK